MKKPADRFSDILTSLPRNLLKAEEEAVRAVSARDLTINELYVLAAVGAGRTDTMTRVAAGLKISVGALTTTMNRLVAKGYVNRFGVPEDRRVVKVRLTEKGAAAVRAHRAFRTRMANELFASMPPDRREALLMAMESLDEYCRLRLLRPVRREPDLKLSPIRIGDIPIPVPIFQGDMGPAFSAPGLAAAVAACGGVGLISAAFAGFAEPDYETDPRTAGLRAFTRDIRDAVRRAAPQSADHPAGVVAAGLVCGLSGYEDFARAAVRAGARILVSGGGIPAALPAIARDADVKLVPIVSSARAVAVLRRKWAKICGRAPDAVIFEGPRKNGHLGFAKDRLEEAEHNFFRTLLEIKNELDDLPNCPLIVANGDMTRADIKKAVSYGADGIQAEDVFVTATECASPESVRRVYREAGARERVLLDSPLGLPARLFANRLTAAAENGGVTPPRCVNCLETCPKQNLDFCLAAGLIAAARGDAENGALFCAAPPPFRSPGAETAPGGSVSVADIFRALTE